MTRTREELVRLGRALINYTCPSSESYDPVFYAEIYRIAPHWWFDTAKENKKKLLEMARRGEPRPLSKTKIGSALVGYTNKGTTYDHEFDAEIRKLRQDWFENTTNKKKEILIEIAKTGKSRPLSKTKIGSALVGYTCGKKGTYDPVFDAEIRKIRPDWFINTAAENKKILIEIAKTGKPRPLSKTKIGKTLVSYTNKGSHCYNPVFDAEIRKIRPDWFINTAAENKKILIEIAKTEGPRPKWKTKLGRALHDYTVKSKSFDPVFDAEIRRLRPDWFK